ncbi:MAG: ATP-binding cassette domain-containing protein [Aquabacterium commune]|uniref:ABC transporter ATP-binding protein n=1 Tax=Aquabacterium commune TaxID=70586 RepID=UPI003BAE5CD8
MPVLLNIADLEFSYEPDIVSSWRLLVPSFELRSGQVTVISGDNMSGKSTFIGIVGGMIDLGRCRGSIFSADIGSHSQRELAEKSIVLSADDKMFPELSVLQNIAIANRTIPYRKLEQSLDPVKAVLLDSGVLNEAALYAPLASLSSGGRALVKLARAYLSPSAIVIVDEISSFLDETRAEYFLSLTLDLARAGRGVIIISHSERDRQQLLQEASTVQFHIHRQESRSEMRESK